MLISTISLFAKQSFTGKVIDISDKRELPGVAVRIENTQFGAFTNNKGIFIIKNLPDNLNRANIIISLIGYETLKSEVDLSNDNNKEFSLKVQPLQTSEVVVSANKKVQAIQDVPISVAVIDKRVLIDRGITRLDDALEYVPGVEVNQDNASIRGSSGFSFGVGSRVSLLIDGFPMVAGDNGDIKFDALPIYNIDRIEVIKGAGSALWGTGAIGGIINLMIEEPTEVGVFKHRTFTGFYTKPRYEQWEFTENLQFNSGVNLSYGQKINALSVVASGSFYSDQGYRDYDNSLRYNLFSKVAYEFNSDTKLKLLFNGALEDRADWVYWNSLDSATLPPTGTNRDIRIDSYKYSGFGEVSHSFDYNNYALIKFGIFNTKYNNSFEVNSEEYRQSDATSYYIDLQGVSNFDIYNRKINLTYGLTQNYVDVKSFTYGNRNQHIVAAYAQAEYSLPNVFTLTLGSRLDREITKGIESNIEFSPKVGINIPLKDHFNLRASFGRGFRVASVAERYSAIILQGFEVVPNLELEPESSWSAEIGTNLQYELFNSIGEIDFSIFHNELENLIEPSFASDATARIQFQNVTKARIQGIELGLKTFLFNTFGIESSLTLMNPIDLSTNKTLNYRSEVLWYSRLILPYKFVEFQADFRYKSRVDNIDIQLGLLVNDSDARVDAKVVDLRLIFDLKELTDSSLKFGLIANNIFDYYYTEMVGNLARTRLLTLQISGEL